MMRDSATPTSVSSTSSAVRRVPDWPGPLIQLVKTVLEDVDFEESSTTLLNLIGKGYNITPSYILQLLAIVLEPEACGYVKKAVQDDLKQAEPRIAMHILRVVLSSNGPLPILSALPRIEKVRVTEAVSQGKTYTIDEDDEDASLLQRAGSRLAESPDVWDLLHGGNLKSSRLRSQEGPLSNQAWLVLEYLVKVWQAESLLHPPIAKARWSPSLLTQITHPVFGPASDVGRILDIVLEPFSSAQADNIEVLQRCEVAMDLCNLLADLAIAGKLDLLSLVTQLAERLKESKVQTFKEFLTVLLNDRPGIKIRVLAKYLENYSAPYPPPVTVTINNLEDVPTDDDIIFVSSSQGGPPTTPVRKPLSQQSNFSKSSTASSRPQPIPSAEKHKHKSSKLSSSSASQSDPLTLSPRKAVSRYLSRVPREIAAAESGDDRPKKRIPSRAATDDAAAGPKISAINAEIKFSHVKLEMLGIYAQSAEAYGQTEKWKAILESGKVLAALRAGRAQLIGEYAKPSQIVELEALEDLRTRFLI